MGAEHCPRSIIKNTEDIKNKAVLTETIKTLTGDKTPKSISIRILFGGETFGKIALVDDNFFPAFEKLIQIRPYYVSNMTTFLKVIYESFPDTQVLAFFETGLFLELPEVEKCYDIPENYYGETSFKKWGFHSIWHYYNAGQSKKADKTISIVLDKNTTVCALNKKKPITTSFGSTPLEGIMGEKTCGDIDPGIVFYLMKKDNYSIQKMDDILKNKSGFCGLCGYDKEMDELVKSYGNDPKVDLAFEVYMNQIKKYIGESIALLGGVSDIIFSGPYVEDFKPIIFHILKDISFIDITLNALPWESKEKLSKISTDNSNVSVYLNKTTLHEIIYKMTAEYIAKHLEVFA
jgi:acetate kinase